MIFAQGNVQQPMLLLSVLIVLELAAMLMMGSKFGLLSVIIVSVIQLVIFMRYMGHNELKNVLVDFKGLALSAFLFLKYRKRYGY